MTKYNLAFCYLFLLLTACQSTSKSYQKIAVELSRIEQQEWSDFSPADSLAQALQAVDSLLQEAEALLPPHDSRRQKQPYAPILSQLYQFQAYLQQFQKDPALYDMGRHLSEELTRENSPIEERINRCQPMLRSATDYYQSAKRKLLQPDSTQLRRAIQIHIHNLRFLSQSYLDSLQQLPYSKQAESLVQTCRFAMKDYIAWCNSQLIEQSQ